MSQKNLYCDICGDPASAFALQPAKVRACPKHASNLMDKNSSVFTIDAFPFIERPEDYLDYVARRDFATRCQANITDFKERSERNRAEALSRLQREKEAMVSVVERSFKEMGMSVEQRYEEIKTELSALNSSLGKYLADKNYALSPDLAALGGPTAPSALFKVAMGDCSFLLAKTLMEHCALLPPYKGLPRAEMGEMLLEKAKDMEADLAEEISVYALEMGGTGPTHHFKAAADRRRKQVAKGLLLVLPSTATDQQKRGSAESHIQAWRTAKESGNSDKALKKLMRGWILLQQWGLETSDLTRELSLAYLHFEPKSEGVAILNRELLFCSKRYLHVCANVVEMYHQAGDWQECAELAEKTLLASDNEDSFEQFRALYYFASSRYQLIASQGVDSVKKWTSQVAAHSPASQCVLLLIHAATRRMEGNGEEAVGLYEEALQASHSLLPNHYLVVDSWYSLGVLYGKMQKRKKAEIAYTQAINVYSINFPRCMAYANCLRSLAILYKSMNQPKASEDAYMQALDLLSINFPGSNHYLVCFRELTALYKSTNNSEKMAFLSQTTFETLSVHFPQSLEFADSVKHSASVQHTQGLHERAKTGYLQAISLYSTHVRPSLNHADCLYSLGELYKAMGQCAEQESAYLQAINIYSAHFPQSLNYADCLNCLAALYMSLNQYTPAETYYLQAIDVYSANSSHSPIPIDCLRSIADLYMRTNLVEKAEAIYLQAIRVLSVDFPCSLEHAQSLMGLGYMYYLAHRYRDAETYTLQAHNIFSPNFPHSLDFAVCLQTLAQLYAP